jgi:uncharacterized protein
MEVRVMEMPSQTNRSNIAPINGLIGRIVTKWAPQQIWLFGSRARGDARANSDWDLFVIVSDSMPDSEFDPIVAYRLQKDSGVRANIFLCHSSDFEMSQSCVNTLSYSVAKEGVLVYGK